MRKGYLILSCISFFLISCSPRFKVELSNPKASLQETVPVVVLAPEDDFSNDGELIGTLKAGDTGFSTSCSYYEIIDQIKAKARASGANLIKIIEHKDPDGKSTCDRIRAELYLVPDFRVHEKLIDWSESRKLVWDDFKGEPFGPDMEKFAAATSCGFGYRTNFISFITKAKVFVYNQFDAEKSWVRSNQKHRPELLEHEQFHFDLSEVYARKLRKRYAEVKIKSSNAESLITSIFQEVWSEYLEEQDQYDADTKHGLDSIAQRSWQTRIREELKSLSAFKGY